MTAAPRRTVVKVGGARLDEAPYLSDLTAHLRALRDSGSQVLLVHGGGREIGDLHAKLDVGYQKQLGLRVTSDASMDIVAMVLCGLVNKRVVAHLVASGLDAVGLSGVDLGLMRSAFLNRKELGRVGGPPKVDPKFIRRLLSEGYLVVLSPVCLGSDGGLMNVNADAVAQTVAVALDAECLEFVTDVEGVRTARGKAESLSPAEIEGLIRDRVADGGMIPKLQAALAALDGGIGRVLVGDLASLDRGTATEVHP